MPLDAAHSCRDLLAGCFYVNLFYQFVADSVTGALVKGYIQVCTYRISAFLVRGQHYFSAEICGRFSFAESPQQIFWFLF